MLGFTLIWNKINIRWRRERKRRKVIDISSLICKSIKPRNITISSAYFHLCTILRWLQRFQSGVSLAVEVIKFNSMKGYWKEWRCNDKNQNFHDMLFCVKQHESRYRAKLLLLLPIINTACKPLWTHREH